MKGCSQCRSLAVGFPEEHFLSLIVLDRALGGPQINTGNFKEDRKALLQPGTEPLILGPPVSFLVTVLIVMWR